MNNIEKYKRVVKLSSFNTRVNNLTDNITKNEKLILEYLDKNRTMAVSTSVHKIAKEIGIAPATVTRFAKKLGYSGLQELKIDLAKLDSKKAENNHEYYSESDTVDKVVLKYINIFGNLIKSSKDLLNESDLEDLVNAILPAEKVYVLGFGESRMMAADLCYKLLDINKSCVYSLDGPNISSNIIHITSKDILLIISFTGEEKPLLEAARLAKNKGVKIASIVRFGKTPISQISDFCLHTQVTQEKMSLNSMSSRFSAFILTDLIYLCLALKNYQNVEDYIKLQREVIKVM